MAVSFGGKYILNIAKIDEQHKQVFHIVNELFEAIDYTKEEIEVFIPELKIKVYKYAVAHFETEEKYMKEVKYPHTAEHIIKHTEFMKYAENIFKIYEEKKTIDIVGISRYMYKWIVEHIGLVDREFAKYYKEHIKK